MNERRTVVATTTRTRSLPLSELTRVLSTRAFRVTPARLADGLGLGMSYGCEADTPQRARVPRALRVAQGLGQAATIRLISSGVEPGRGWGCRRIRTRRAA